MDATIRSFLKKDPLQSLPIEGFFANYPLEKVYQSDDFLLLTGTSDWCWALLAGSGAEGMQQVIEAFGFQTTYFANVEEWMVPVLMKYRPLEWKMTTMRYYLPWDQAVDPPGVACHPLQPSDAAYVYQHSAYKEYTSEAYIADRLQKDLSFGISVEGGLAGWGLTHDDGSLGFLNVLAPYRKKGLGENILRSMILQRQMNRQPIFVNVETSNIKSINLIRKLGFFPDRLVSWVKVG